MHKLMNTLASGSFVLVAACTGADDKAELPGAVTGSDFHCTGDWPDPRFHPCNGQALTFANSDEPGVVNLTLFADQMGWLIFEPIGSHVFIDLRFGGGGAISASAREDTFVGDGTAALLETSLPIAESIHPIVVSPTPEGRNAGEFSLTFTWGGISGTYDTEAAE